jgi:hypothetical protein
MKGKPLTATEAVAEKGLWANGTGTPCYFIIYQKHLRR